jgi:cellulose biosynthesis protein BcsQ
MQLAYNPVNPLLNERLDLIVGQFELFKYYLPHDPELLGDSLSRFQKFVDYARGKYDLIVIDCAPSNSFITEFALRAADHVVAPVTPDKYALRGLQALDRLMREAYELERPCKTHILRNLAKDVSGTEQTVIDNYKDLLLDSRIPRSDSFGIKNPDPEDRVRDPLTRLAFRSGRTNVKGALQQPALELLTRAGMPT